MLHPSQQAAYKRTSVFSLYLQSIFCLLFLCIFLGTCDVVHIWRSKVLSYGVETKPGWSGLVASAHTLYLDGPSFCSRLALNMQSSCFSLLSAGIYGPAPWHVVHRPSTQLEPKT